MTSHPSIWSRAADLAFPDPDEEGSDRELANRCAADLRVFIREAWPLLEPARPFVPNWHIDCIAEHLMAASAGEIPRLLINEPPRTTKSIMVAVAWPAWEWMRKAYLRWLFASYAQDFAQRDSLKMRRLIRAEGGRTDGNLFQRIGYQGVLRELGQSWQLEKDQDAKNRYETTETGMRMATSVGGMATGEGGDRVVCLHADTIISTDVGDLPISQIVNGCLDVGVLGDDGTWQRIAKHEVSKGRPLLEIETADGSRLRCTEDHPIYLEGHGWRPARDVESLHGNLHMRRLRDTVRPAASARGQSEDGPVLLTQMLRPSRERQRESGVGWRQSRTRVPGLPEDLPVEAVRGEATDSLLASVLRAGVPRGTATGVRDMRSVVHPFAGPHATVLRPGVRRDSASDSIARCGERSLRGRVMGDAVLAGVHGEAQGHHPGARRESLRDLRARELDLAGASPRRLEDEPRHDEPRDDVPIVPSPGAYTSGDQRSLDERVRIVAVRRCGTPDAVYNLRVEPHHHYYADGLLVHNCDDPLSAKQARSPAHLKAVRTWWDETMTTRFNDSQAIAVIVMQRLNEADLAGHLLAAEDSRWHHLCLPAEYIPAHPFTYPAKATLPSGRVIDGDPRTEPGELLDPVRLPAQTLKERRADLGSYAFAGQYQQQPAPEEGGMFKREWWRRRWQPGFDLYLEHGFDRVIQSWDMRGGIYAGSDSSSYVVGQVWGFHGADCYLMAQVRGRYGFADTLHVVAALSEFEPRAVAKLVENKANGPAVIKALRSKVQGLIPIEPDGNKEARASAVSPIAEAGNVILPAADTIPCPTHYADSEGERHEIEPTTVADWIHEMSVFPLGRDDMVDAMSQALNWAKPVARLPVDDAEALREKPQSIMSGVLTERF